jgi:autotransporter strand-loop-strand O-heptosyltransferase
MPQVERFRKISKSNVVVATFFNKLFEKVYPEIKFIEPGLSEKDIYASYSIGCYGLEDKSRHISPWNKIPLGQVCSDTLGIDFKEEKAKIDVKDKRNRLENEKYVCISTSSTAGCKHWHKWQELVDHLSSRGYKVVVIQKEPLDYMDLNGLKNVIFPDTEASIEEAIAWLYHCEFYIGLSSGISWLAHSLDKEVVMIAGFTEPYNEFTCRRVINYNVCYGCWHNHLFDKGDWRWCPEHKDTEREFECSKTIELKDIIKVMPTN